MISLRSQSTSNDYHGKRLMVPCRITLIEGSGFKIGAVMYSVVEDKSKLVLFNGLMKEEGVYDPWVPPLYPAIEIRNYLCNEKDDKQTPPVPCDIRGCSCNLPRLWVFPFDIAVGRQISLVDNTQKHWFQYCTVWNVFQDMHKLDSLFQEAESSNLDVWAKQVYIDSTWRNEWKRNTPAWRINMPFSRKLNYFDADVFKREEVFSTITEPKNVMQLEKLPLEVWEVLLKYLDGKMWINLSKIPRIENRLLDNELILTHKRALHFYNFCKRDLDRSTMIKIWSSFDTRVSCEYDAIDNVTWEDIFSSYGSYWDSLRYGEGQLEELDVFQDGIEAEMIHLKQFVDSGLAQDKQIIRVTGSGGGRMMYNMTFPYIKVDDYTHPNAVVTEDYRGNCRRGATIGRAPKPPTTVVSKIVYFPAPELANPQSPSKPCKVTKVLIVACEHWFTLFPLQKGPESRYDFPTDVNDELVRPMDPILEVQDNVVALWARPQRIQIFLVEPTPVDNGESYFIDFLYHLEHPLMEVLWNHFALFSSDFLPVITEHKGYLQTREGHYENIMESKTYIFPPTEPTYYGLAMVSPLYGIERIKPDCYKLNSAAVESIPPEHYLKNGREYVSCLREWSCSGKGHGLFVFCNDLAIAVSWNCIAWIFEPMNLPLVAGNGDHVRNVIHVDVVSETGILVIANQSIFLLEMMLNRKPPVERSVSKINDEEPELDLQVVRVFHMDAFPIQKQLTHFELNFDHGKPFFLIGFTETPVRIWKSRLSSMEFWNDLNFELMRIDFGEPITKKDFLS